MHYKISTIFVFAAFAAGFALGASSAALADHCKGKHKNDDGCDGGGGGGAGVIFSVAVVGDAPNGDYLYVPSCTAQTPSSGGNLDSTAIFPRHDLCATLTTSTGATLTDDIIIHTETAKSGEIVGVQVTGQDVIGDDGIAHESDVMPVDPPVIPNESGFTLHVHALDTELWKLDTHRVMKKSKRIEWVGTFSLGDMIYTPDP